MRIVPRLLLAALLAVPSLALAEVNVNINLGAPVLPLPPLPAPPRILFNAPPLFLAPASLGFYVGVDMPYDMVLLSGSYYLFRGNHWFRGSNYNGPWTATRYEQLPPQIRQYRVEKIRYYRDHEYRAYREDRDHYRGRYFRPGRGGNERWQDDRGYRKEEKRWEKEEHRGGWKHGRGDD